MGNRNSSNNKQEHKILLLGPQDCGKTTLLKQLFYIVNHGYESTYSIDFKEQIYSQLAYEMHNALNEEYTNKSALYLHDTQYRNAVTKIRSQQTWSDVLDAINYIWKNDEVIRLYFGADEKYLLRTTQYFFNNIDRICTEDYIPTKNDILRIAIPTRQVVEKKIILNGCTSLICDAAEQRHWIGCLKNVDTMVFVVSLADYINRMDHALRLFDDIFNYDHWSNQGSNDPNFVLLLNMNDLFEKTIRTESIANCPLYEQSDFNKFVAQYKYIVSMVCASFCNIDERILIPMEIKRLVVMFCGFGINFDGIDNVKLTGIRSKENNIEFENEIYDFESCRYYIKQKFEALDRRGGKKSIHTYFTSALDTESVKSAIEEITLKIC